MCLKSRGCHLNIETEAIISLLKLTDKGCVSHETLKADARMPLSTIKRLLQTLQNDGLVNSQGNVVKVDTLNRLKLAVRAVESGANLEKVSTFLQWQEFEAIAAYAFEHHGYNTLRNVHFSHGKKRYEIDIAGYGEHVTICADCKHWKRGFGPSVLKKIVDDQARRTCALAESLPNPKIRLGISPKRSLTFVPAILTLVYQRVRFCGGVPVVSVLQLQDFLYELPGNLEAVKHFQREKGSFSRPEQLQASLFSKV